VQEFTDPKTGKRKLQIFRAGANFNALQVILPTLAAENEEHKLRIFYTSPEDSNTAPIIIPAG
jgi:hypothetical protein